jgi:plastocyanin
MGGKSATVEFPKPGVYFYYCSLHAAYRSAYGRAAANTSADAYPVAMEGLVVVATP